MIEQAAVLIREACQRSSQRKVAERLGIPQSFINQILNADYEDIVTKLLQDHADEANGKDWLAVLMAECKSSSQASIARRLNVSGSVISSVLKGHYQGDLKRIEELVRGEFMGAVVQCPILGEITSRACQDWQARPFGATNPTRVQVFRACRNGCPNATSGRCRK